jgi:uncharacterized surface protein with fasciclin (FAS1) repeats
MRKVLGFLLVFVLALTAVVPALAQDRPNLVEALQNDPDGRFTTLVAAVEAAGLVDTLSEEGDLTLLAPTNDAFDAALDYLGIAAEDLLADTETLTQVLTYHVLPERTRSSQLFVGATIATLQGEEITFEESSGGQLTANGVVVGPDANIVTTGGVIHVLNGVLLPSAIQEAADANRAQIRVAHFSPDGGPVDVYIDGELSDLQGVTFGTVSDWIEVAGRSYDVAIAPAGGEPGDATTFEVAGGTWTTIAAVGVVGLESFELRALAEDYSPIGEGTARLTVLHALPGAPAVDLRLNDTIVVGQLGYPGSLGDNDGVDIVNVSSGRYNLSVVPAGTTTPVVLSVEDFPLNSGTNYFLAVVGTPTNPQYVLRSTSVGAGE